MAHLLITTHDGESSTLDTGLRERLTIGRSADRDIVLRDPALSRNHAEMIREQRDWIVRDCASRNGTFVNGIRLEAAATLRAGDLIEFGRSSVKFEPLQDSRPSVQLSETGFCSGETSVLTFVDAREARPPDGWFEVLEEASRTLLAHESLEALYDKVLNLVFRAVKPERAAFFSRRSDGEVVCESHRDDSSSGEMPVFRSIVRQVVDERVSVLIRDAQTLGDASDSLADYGVRSVMAVPLRGTQDVIGIIYADSLVTAGLFGEHELRLLTMLADLATIHIENTHRFRQQVREEHLEREARAAAEIQERLFPRDAPRIPGYEFDWLTVPCYEVGGDYCDCMSLEGNRYGMVLADVAGKGMGAAMLMAVTQATLRTHVRVGVELDLLVKHMNTAMLVSTPENRFVTFFFVEIDSENHSLRYLNAGHAPPPLLVRCSGAVEKLAAWSIPLGLIGGIDCISRRTELGPGDFIFACSDGVTDTLGPDASMFGEERLERLLTGLAGRSAADVKSAVEAEVTAFAQGTPPTDDLTMAILRRER